MARQSEPRDSGIQNYVCQELEARVFRGNERLGMELNAYNQILSFQPGGPTDRHPDVKKHDRILGVDGIMLGSKMLTDVLQNAPEHTFIIERWAPPRGQVAAARVAAHAARARQGARQRGVARGGGGAGAQTRTSVEAHAEQVARSSREGGRGQRWRAGVARAST